MKRYLIITLLCLVVMLPLSAQYFDDISEFTQEGVGFDMTHAKSSAAFLDWTQLQMHHSVSMSMGGSAFGSQSYLTYQNQFYMPLGSRLSFYGNLYYQLQTYASNPALARLNSPSGDIYFDANLVYKLSENSSISFGIARYPSMYGYSYLPGAYYEPYLAYDPMYNSISGGLVPSKRNR
jgi:hypothetical protein